MNNTWDNMGHYHYVLINTALSFLSLSLVMFTMTPLPRSYTTLTIIIYIDNWS